MAGNGRTADARCVLVQCLCTTTTTIMTTMTTTQTTRTTQRRCAHPPNIVAVLVPRSTVQRQLHHLLQLLLLQKVRLMRRNSTLVGHLPTTAGTNCSRTVHRANCFKSFDQERMQQPKRHLALLPRNPSQSSPLFNKKTVSTLPGRDSLGLTGAEADSLFNSLLKDSPQGEDPAGVEEHPVAVESKAAVLANPPQAVALPRRPEERRPYNRNSLFARPRGLLSKPQKQSVSAPEKERTAAPTTVSPSTAPAETVTEPTVAVTSHTQRAAVSPKRTPFNRLRSHLSGRVSSLSKKGKVVSKNEPKSSEVDRENQPEVTNILVPEISTSDDHTPPGLKQLTRFRPNHRRVPFSHSKQRTASKAAKTATQRPAVVETSTSRSEPESTTGRPHTTRARPDRRRLRPSLTSRTLPTTSTSSTSFTPAPTTATESTRSFSRSHLFSRRPPLTALTPRQPLTTTAVEASTVSVDPMEKLFHEAIQEPKKVKDSPSTDAVPPTFVSSGVTNPIVEQPSSLLKAMPRVTTAVRTFQPTPQPAFEAVPGSPGRVSVSRFVPVHKPAIQEAVLPELIQPVVSAPVVTPLAPKTNLGEPQLTRSRSRSRHRARTKLPTTTGRQIAGRRIATTESAVSNQLNQADPQQTPFVIKHRTQEPIEVILEPVFAESPHINQPTIGQPQTVLQPVNVPQSPFQAAFQSLPVARPGQTSFSSQSTGGSLSDNTSKTTTATGSTSVSRSESRRLMKELLKSRLSTAVVLPRAENTGHAIEILRERVTNSNNRNRARG